jgi:hypothetical protein
MPGGAGDGGLARIGFGATDAAMLESACRFAAATPASHDALWTGTAFVEDMMAAG